jgi:glucan phosphorylase
MESLETNIKLIIINKFSLYRATNIISSVYKTKSHNSVHGNNRSVMKSIYNKKIRSTTRTYVVLLYLVVYTKVHPKYSELVSPSIQKLWYRESPVDVWTTMSSESVCQVALSWVDVDSFHTRLFGVVHFAIASVREFLDTPL